MKKIYVLLYGLCLSGISLYGFLSHSYYLQLFVSISKPYFLVRATLVMVLAVYAFVPWIRIYVTKILLRMAGLVLLSVGLILIFSPNLLGYINSWILLGDDLILIEGGIIAIVLSAELSTRKTKLLTTDFINMRLLVALKSRKLTYSPRVQSPKLLKIPS